MFVFVQGDKDELDSTSDDRLEKLKRMREKLKLFVQGGKDELDSTSDY